MVVVNMVLTNVVLPTPDSPENQKKISDLPTHLLTFLHFTTHHDGKIGSILGNNFVSLVG